MTFNIVIDPNRLLELLKERLSDRLPKDAKIVEVLFNRSTGDIELACETHEDVPKTIELGEKGKVSSGRSDFADFLRKVAERCIRLFEERQSTHGDAWKSLDSIDLASMIFVKAMREKEASRAQMDSSVQEEHLYDLINYAIMGLYRLKEGQN